jgi:hypothetical protein
VFARFEHLFSSLIFASKADTAFVEHLSENKVANFDKYSVSILFIIFSLPKFMQMYLFLCFYFLKELSVIIKDFDFQAVFLIMCDPSMNEL